MTLLHEAFDAKKFDTRVLDRNVNRGLITADEAEKNAKKLPDDSDNASYVELDSFVVELDSDR